MFVLMPSEPHIPFITLAVIFVMATLLGFASTSPGGLGVFDAAMFIGLWQFDKEDLLAGLLLFRLFYYLLPFAITLAVLGVRELLLDVRELAPHQREPAVAEPKSVPLGTPRPGDRASALGQNKQGGGS
jgi:glycosyltransferase 2 family protein